MWMLHHLDPGWNFLHSCPILVMASQWRCPFGIGPPWWLHFVSPSWMVDMHFFPWLLISLHRRVVGDCWPSIFYPPKPPLLRCCCFSSSLWSLWKWHSPVLFVRLEHGDPFFLLPSHMNCCLVKEPPWYLQRFSPIGHFLLHSLRLLVISPHMAWVMYLWL